MIHQAIINVNEANEYLNISIKNVDKVIKDEKTAKELLEQDIEVYGKYDGTKLSLIRTDAKWSENWWDMFIVSYKGNVIYGTEFHAVGDDSDLDKTVGVSQYKDVVDYVAENFKKWKSIPRNTEFFIEFLMNKPTLTRKYTKLRQLILIGNAKISSLKINHGKIITKTSQLDMTDREKWAKILGLNLPELIFKGKLIEMPKGLNERAKGYFKDFEDSFKGLPPMGYWELTSNFFKRLPSLYGASEEEGVVLQLSKPIKNTSVLKIVQDDQYDKDLRFKIKMQYRMEVKSEDEYWIKVREKAEEIINTLNLNKDFRDVLHDLSTKVYSKEELTFSHSKKTPLNIRDDIQLTAKSMIMRKLPGNDGALVVGKFRVFTNGHKKMFGQALKNHDFLVVALVSNKETKKTLELRKKMIEAVYPGIEIVTTTSGNLLTIINKTQQNINVVLAGSDRVDGYRKQLVRNLNVQVEEVRRGEDDESATKVIRNLSDIKYFRLNTPKEIYKFYDELLDTYGVSENFRRQGKNMLREIVENKKIRRGNGTFNLNEADAGYEGRMVEIFTKAVKDELSASISYKAMAEKVIGAGNTKFREELEQHGKEEFEHFTELMEYAATHGILEKLKIDLDEKVIGDAPSTVKDMIAFSQNLELEAIKDYNNAAMLAMENGDIETHEFFRELASDEEGHYDDVAVYTGKTRKFGVK